MKVLEKENHTVEMITNSDKFPEGLRILAVDDDPVCLRILQVLLVKCRYEVTVTKEAVNALKILRENKNNFDIVLTDVHMSDMDGFRLLEIIGLEMDIPVIMMSSNEDQATVMKGIEHGACDYLLKPIRLEVVKNIWQHVIRKSKFDNNDLNIGKGTIKAITSKGKKRPKDDENSVYSDENGSTRRKSRITWTRELHKVFMHACEKLGPDKAVPSKILEEMNVLYLTREQIASHLQKYRTALKKTEGQQKNNRIDLNGMNEHLANAAVLSFNNQGSNGVNRLNGFRTNGPISFPMNQFGDPAQKPDAFSHSFLNPMPRLLLPSQPNLSSQQFPNNLEVLDESYHRIPVQCPRDINSDSVRIENLHQQNCYNKLSQCFSPRNNLCNGVMEVPSRMSGYNASNEPRPTSLPFLHVNNLFDFEFLDEAHLSNTILPDQNDPGIPTVQETLPGLHGGIVLANTDMQNSNVGYQFDLEEFLVEKDSFGQLDTDDLYHLSRCSSTVDELIEVVKQALKELNSAQLNLLNIPLTYLSQFIHFAIEMNSRNSDGFFTDTPEELLAPIIIQEVVDIISSSKHAAMCVEVNNQSHSTGKQIMRYNPQT